MEVIPSDLLTELGLAAGAAIGSGIRLYGTVAALGFLHRVGALHLPGRLEVLAQTPILVLACALFLVEFLADKIPAVDSVWDSIHTFIRIPAAGVLGFAALSDVSEPWRMAAALLCGTIALSTHSLKASTRLALNMSPEPFTNWAASLSEDALLVMLIWLIVQHPLLALTAALLVLALGFLLLRWIARSLKRIFATEPRPAGLTN